MQPKGNLLLVDDDEDLLAVLARWCTDEGYAVVCAKDGFEALYKLKERPFDLVVTDLAMPGMHGLKLLEMLRAYDPTVQVLVLTGHATLETAVEALREGRAFDFLRKPLAELGLLTRALGRAMDRRRELTTPPPPEPMAPKPELTILTDRERDVARLLSQGLHRDKIARQLHMGVGTVKNYLTTIYEKLDVRGQAEAMAALSQYEI